MDKPLRDVIAPDLDVLFCGINPSLLSAERGHHFARPGNRFWPALHRAGLTPRLLSPDEDALLPSFGLGITNVVARPTRAAAELTVEELRAGGEELAALVREHRPRVLAVLGITAWRQAFDRPRAVLGRQPERIGGAETWVAPNPSGLNAHHQLPDLARRYAQLRTAARSAAEPGEVQDPAGRLELGARSGQDGRVGEHVQRGEGEADRAVQHGRVPGR
jgi:TDG/mug DNA glycosylase family protein